MSALIRRLRRAAGGDDESVTAEVVVPAVGLPGAQVRARAVARAGPG